ncbi:MAG: hypothetical protein HY473_01510 [Candidatus Sungbacteria bacterium]|uniref:Uncharacterized protein n=1 Tax=Candidatus Sungiibacteriota bacterium TaxID=2750080 RepID=A0A933DTD3_9BACT|nr:hypothetical protein [Candidatus Sungbacteria bacterium]
MRRATLAQGNQVQNLILQSGVPTDQLQKLLESGFISDILDANVDEVDRNQLRKVLGLKPLPIKPREKRSTLDYYPWLERYAPLGDMNLTIHDSVASRHEVVTRDGIKTLKVKPIMIRKDNEALQERAVREMREHQLNDCLILDKQGFQIGLATTNGDGWSFDWEFNFQDAAYLLLRNFADPSTIVICEIGE